MLKLYFCPRTRSTRPRWLLEELGVPYELERVDLAKGEHKRPEYLAIHPHGVVPALVDGSTVLIESVAICLHLADKFPEKGLAPAVGTPARALYYQWMVYAVATLEPAIVQYYANTVAKGEDDRDPDDAREAKQKVDTIAAVLVKALNGRAFIVGDTFTAADVVLGSMLGWAKSMGLLKDHPRLEAYVKGLTERPAFRRAQA
ncbi:glutathione S-transferase family protein [Myxococcota bacterium]|nr:glutathione S-transferase family protein [Myxococcota bacterium]